MANTPKVVTLDLTEDETKSNNAQVSPLEQTPEVSTKAITSFQDTNPTIEASPPGPINLDSHIPQPYPDPGMKPVCERLMKIGSVDWQVSDPSGTNLHRVCFPDVLLTFDSLWCRMSRFKFFRAGAEFVIRLNSTKFHSGQLLVNWMPDASASEYNAYNTTLQTSCMINPHIILANTQTDLGIKIPYQGSSDWMDIEKYAGAEPVESGEIGTLGIWVLTPLQTSSDSASSTVSVTLFAKFTDFVINGPHSKSYVQPTLTPHKRFVNRCIAWDVDDQRFKITSDSESRARTVQSTVAGVSKRLTSFKSFLSSIPIVGGLVKPITDLLPFSKPPSLSAPIYTNSVKGVRDFNTKGLQLVDKLAQDPECHVADDCTPFGIADQRCSSLLALARSPCLIAIIGIPLTTDPATDVFSLRVGPFPSVVENMSTHVYTLQHTWASFVASRHAFWRGSIKYMFLVSASSYTSARIRISWTPTTQSVSEIENSGDVISEIYDITGDTIIKFTVPYLSASAGIAMGNTLSQPLDDLGFIQVSLVNRISSFQANASANNIYMTLWTSVGEDFQFFEPREELSFYPTGDMCDVFSKSFPSLVTASQSKVTRLTFADESTSQKEYHLRFTNTTSYPDMNYGIKPYQGMMGTGFFPAYRFFRGGFRIRMFAGSQAIVNVSKVMYNPSFDVFTGNIITNYSSTKYFLTPESAMAYVEIPYHATKRFYKLSNVRDSYFTSVWIGGPSSTTPTVGIDYSVADDFTFGGLASILPATFDPPSSKAKEPVSATALPVPIFLKK